MKLTLPRVGDYWSGLFCGNYDTDKITGLKNLITVIESNGRFDAICALDQVFDVMIENSWKRVKK